MFFTIDFVGYITPNNILTTPQTTLQKPFKNTPKYPRYIKTESSLPSKKRLFRLRPTRIVHEKKKIESRSIFVGVINPD